MLHLKITVLISYKSASQLKKKCYFSDFLTLISLRIHQYSNISLSAC